MRIWFLLTAIAVTVIVTAAQALERTEREIVVSAADAGEEFEEPGGYGQPQWAERSRASATTKLYVLSPFEVFVGVLSESDFLRRDKSVHDLTQEIDESRLFMSFIRLKQHRARAVAKQDACAPVGVIDDAAHGVAANHQDLLVRARAH